MLLVVLDMYQLLHIPEQDHHHLLSCVCAWVATVVVFGEIVMMLVCVRV